MATAATTDELQRARERRERGEPAERRALLARIEALSAWLSEAFAGAVPCGDSRYVTTPAPDPASVPMPALRRLHDALEAFASDTQGGA